MAKKEASNKKENSKNKRSFFKDFKAELKKVSWPTPKQLVNNTIAVITIVIITAVIVFVLDLAFETLNKHGVEKIKQVITTNSETVDNSTDNATESTTEETTTDENSEETPTTSENTEASNEENQTTEVNTENQAQ